MQISYQASTPSKTKLGALALFFTEGQTASPAGLEAPLQQQVKQTLALKDFTGKAGQVSWFPTGISQIERIALVGLGKPAELTREGLRRAAGKVVKEMRGLNLERAALWMPDKLPASQKGHAGEALTEGAILGAYSFDRYKEKPAKSKNDKAELKHLVIQDPAKAASKQAVEKGRVRGEAICLARDLGNTPGNDLTPTELAKRAKALAKENGLTCKVLERADMEKLGMGMLLAVSQGSVQPPKLITLTYKAPKAKKTLAMIGKGVTFDSGGISLKPGPGMDEMKFDMCGAAAVLGAMQAIAALKPNINVVGVIPATENLPGGNAIKPGDIVKSLAGKQVEILNTDAEGRLILGDALAYTVATFKPDGMVDLATLTGACVIALGHYATGAVGNNDAFMNAVVDAGKSSGDIAWPLPNFPEYAEALKGKYGDLQNIGGRDGGAITGGLFLKNFVKEVPWVHLDIAGTAWGVKNVGHIPNEGATGVGTALLIDLAEQWA